MRTPAKLGLLGSLYFSQGLPFGFFTQALPVVLRQRGFSLGEIGLASLLALPWALKFLWAPAVDRSERRRSWIIPLQIASAATLSVLAAAGGTRSIAVLMTAVLLLNLVAATQDIATDGLAVDLLAPGERGLANGVQVAGYRVGMIAGGGVLLILHDRLGSASVFLAMAALTALATLPIALAREPARASRPERTPSHFLRRPGAARLLLIIVAYKFGDYLATGMLRPFLADLGLGLEDIGWLLGTVGFVAGLLGALAGGALVNRVGRKQALIGFGLLQVVTIGGYAYAAQVKSTDLELYALCAAEHFAGGMATVALFTCMMDWCTAESAATDYTVQASAVVIATGVASALAGFSAQALGYVAHFGLAALLALAALVVVAVEFPVSSGRTGEDRTG